MIHTISLREDDGGSERGAVSTADVLDSFGSYQPKTVPMVAEEFDIDVDTARDHLDRLTDWQLLTLTRASTESPIWVRAHPEE